MPCSMIVVKEKPKQNVINPKGKSMYHDGLSNKRRLRERHIKKKEYILKISHDVHPLNHRGMLNKGKIHYSLPQHNAKTRNKGRRRFVHGNYHENLNYKCRDLRRVKAMTLDERDFWEQVQ